MNFADMASYLCGSYKWQDKITKFDKLIHVLWTLIHPSNNLIHSLLISFKKCFLKAANHTLLYISESIGGKLWYKFSHATGSFGGKSSRVSVKKLELCSRTDLHSTVPLTQGTVPGASFWGLVSEKFSANLSRAFSQFFLLLFWRRWTSSIEDGVPVPKPACVRRSWSWIYYQKLSRGIIYCTVKAH